MDSSHKTVTTPEVALIAITRVALGVGIGFLLGPRLRSQARNAAGLALIVVGVATTVPLAIEVFGARCETETRRENDRCLPRKASSH